MKRLILSGMVAAMCLLVHGGCATAGMSKMHRTIYDYTKTSLEMEGHKVQAFEDAKPALESVDFGAVDLVVTDLKMPTRGEEAIRIIRERGCQVPILVMSGEVDEARVCELEALGVTEIVRKPFELRSFLALVGRSIGGSQRGRV